MYNFNPCFFLPPSRRPRVAHALASRNTCDAIRGTSQRSTSISKVHHRDPPTNKQSPHRPSALPPTHRRDPILANPPPTHTPTMFAARPLRALLPPTARAFSSTARAPVARMSLVGRLGTAPEEVVVSGDRTIVRYNVGTSHGRGENEKTSWFRVANFPTSEKQKEFLMGIPKGALVFVDADARMESFVDAEGNKRSNLSLIASKLFLGSGDVGWMGFCWWAWIHADFGIAKTDVLQRPKTESVDVNEEGLVQDA